MKQSNSFLLVPVLFPLSLAVNKLIDWVRLGVGQININLFSMISVITVFELLMLPVVYIIHTDQIHSNYA